ncbi:helix-turn-helix domain-containing protein [Mammaliicoccus sp. I-M36]|uniref:TetR/AcrR family transcriptional regulator n=1 Tax=Mammaliicoccus sp. I-M36 TaxID=2898695 RepID=UPI001EFBD0B8|nr:helix-turn-helix domain-containing protein [Mammaliicoccus sp. I-M36]
MKYDTNNPVAIKSQQWILEALLELMHVKEFKKITIKEITQKADVNRSTFYRNFDTREDVLNQYIEDLALIYVEQLQKIEDISMRKVADVFFGLCIDHLDFFITLKKNDLSNFVLQGFNTQLPFVQEILSSKWPYKIDDEYLEFALAFNAGGMWNMFNQWIEGDMTQTYTDLVEAFKEISKFNISERSIK